MITIHIERTSDDTREVAARIWEIRKWFVKNAGSIQKYQFIHIDDNNNKKLLAESFLSFMFDEEMPEFGNFIERIVVECPHMCFYQDRKLHRTPQFEEREPYEWYVTFEEDSMGSALAVQFKLTFM